MKPITPDIGKGSDLFKSFRMKVNKIIQEKIEYYSKHYKNSGFWKNGDGVDHVATDYIYFPSAEAAKDWYNKSFAKVPHEAYRKQKVGRSDYYHDGDKLSVDPYTQYTVNTEIEYNSNGPYAVVRICYDGLETLEEVAERIWSTIVVEARKEYIKTLKT